MSIDQQRLDDFLRLSVHLTGFSKFQLQGTGHAEDYFSTLSEIVGDGIVSELLDAFRGIESRAGGDDAAVAEGIRLDVLGSPKLGPVARNVIKLWYVGTWYQLPDDWRLAYGTSEKDTTYVVSAAAFTDGLLWPTLGVNPPAAKAQGWGTWGDKPRVTDFE